MYFVKTRNWYCKQLVHRLLSLTPNAYRGDSYNDGDGKFILETANPLSAWLTWAYWYLLSPFSGGWTYIIRPGYQGGMKGYKSVY